MRNRTEFFINDLAIEDPLNIGDFYLVRAVDSRMNGNIYVKRGNTEGVDNLSLTNPDAIQMILGLQDTYLTEAEATFRALRYGNEIFSTDVDFSSIREMRNGELQINLKDRQSETFIENIDTPYELELGNNETFSSETVFTDYALGLDVEKLKIEPGQTTENQQINPVFKADNKATLLGSLLETEDFRARSFYKNTTGGKIRLNMSIDITANITTPSTSIVRPKIVIRDTNGNVLYDLAITEASINGTKAMAVVAEYSLDVAIDASVSLFFQVISPLSSFVIELTETSVINLSEGDFDNISIPVLTVNDAFRQLVNKASGGLLSCQGFAGLSHLRLSPYSVVRGRAGKVNISFGQLWDDLNALYCLKLSRVNDQLVMESYVDSFSNGWGFEVRDIIEYSIETDFGGLYKSVKAGFNTWKSNNDAGLPERTAPITLVSALKSSPSDLDLTVKTLVSSLKMLSEAYLMRNRPGTENENTEKDQSIFLLSSDSAKPINSIAAVTSWVPIIGKHHRTLIKSAGEGAYMNEDYSRDLAGDSTIFTPKYMIMSCNMETEDFISCGDFLHVIDVDKEFLVYATEIKHYPMTVSEPGQGNTAITGRIINLNNA